MAGIIVDVSSDIQKLQKLKAEIASVKQEVKGIDIRVRLDIKESIETRLKALSEQYTALVMKIAEAEGKIKLSVHNINKASEAIIQAQEKVSKVTGTTTQQPSATVSPSNTSAETASIQAQAKAYEDLRMEINDILGTRDANIKRMVNEMNAIRLINAEIKKITKTQGESSSLSSAQQKRLEQLNNSLLTHKTALSEVRQTLSNNVRLDNAAATSMNGLSQSLSRMRVAYRQLTEEERNSPIGKELLASINQADTKIKELDATIGNHQRNVGNYGKQWNGLSMSIQQVGRELPSLAYGPKVFFSAISNNLPILADEIKRARTEYDLLKKSGQSATPVWKQIASSLFSWQSALTVGITLLTLYGDKVVDWISGMFKANSAVKELLSAEQEMALSRSKVSESIKKESAELDILYSKLKSAAISTKERTAAVNEWQKRYPEYANILNGENINLGKLESAYKALSKEIYANAVARSYADKIAELSVKKEKEEIKRLNQKLTVSRAEQKYNKQKEDFDKQKEKGFGTATAKIEARDKVEKARKNIEEQKRIYNDLVNNVKNYDSNIATIENHIKTADLFPQPKEGTFDYWTQQKNIAETTLESIASTQKELMDAGKFEGIPQEIINQYKQAVKLKAEADKALKIYDDPTKQENQAEKLREEQEKYKLLMDKQKLDRQRQTEDLESQLDQSKIDAMTDGFDKEQAQRDLNNKKEIQALERQKDDYIRAIIQAEKDKFDAKEDINAKQKKGYVKQTFDSSTVSVDTSKQDKIIENTKTKQGIDEWQQREASMNEYLLKYGTFTQKKEAIDKKYRDAIEKETSLGGKNSLQKEWEEATANLDLSKLKQEINWEMIFGDLSKVAKEQLINIKKQLQEFKKSDEFKKATPEQIQVIEGALNSINNAMVDKGGFFGGMTESVNELKIATEELKKAEEELAEANKKGTEAEKEEAQKKVNQAKNKQQNAETNVTKSSDKTIQHLTSVGDAIAQLGSSAEISLSSFGNAAGNIVDVFSEAGSKIGGLVGAIFSILDGIQSQGLDGFVGNILGSVAGAVGGIFDTLTFGAFGLKGADYSEYDAMVAKYDVLLDVWDELLDKKKAYIKESYGAEATKAGEEALRLLNSEKQITKELASSRLDAGKSAGSHSINYRMWKGSYDYNGQNWKDVAPEISNSLGGVDFSSMWSMLEMSSEQLEWIKTNYSGLWAHMDGDFKGYVDNIIEYGEVEKEIIASVKEQITGISLDSFQDSYVNMLSDMDSTNEDFADNFEEYLKKSILQSLVAKNYSSKIQDLYDSWATAGEDDVYTDDEINELRDKQQKITDEMLAKREELMKTFGWDSSSGSSSQDSTQKGFAAASQDSISELNGRFTAGAIAWEETKNQSILQSQSLNILTVKADAILTVNTETRNIADEIRTIQVNSYLELQEIRENTGMSAKSLKAMEVKLDKIESNTKALSTK